MEQLAAALTKLTQFQQEQQHRLEESQRQQEERQQQDEEQRRQQYEVYKEEVRIMHEQHVEQMGGMREVLKTDQNTTNTAHLKMTLYQENEDNHEFLKAFEGIMKIQEVKETEWVFCLTLLLNGKVRANCTNL